MAAREHVRPVVVLGTGAAAAAAPTAAMAMATEAMHTDDGNNESQSDGGH
jgi:hypothetical protein